MRAKLTFLSALMVCLVVSSPLIAADSSKEAPAVETTTLSGEELSLESYEGQVVLLNFWGVH